MTMSDEAIAALLGGGLFLGALLMLKTLFLDTIRACRLMETLSDRGYRRITGPAKPIPATLVPPIAGHSMACLMVKSRPGGGERYVGVVKKVDKSEGLGSHSSGSIVAEQLPAREQPPDGKEITGELYVRLKSPGFLGSLADRVIDGAVSMHASKVAGGLEPEFAERFTAHAMGTMDFYLTPRLQQTLVEGTASFPLDKPGHTSVMIRVVPQGFSISCVRILNADDLASLLALADRLSDALSHD